MKPLTSLLDSSFRRNDDLGLRELLGRNSVEHEKLRELLGEPLLAASMGCRAAWPTVRHLADKLPRTADLLAEGGIYKDSSGCCAK